MKKIETLNGRDLTGKSQHGFKKNHSTVTAMLEIQERIAQALDEGKHVAMVSLDLSAAFDVVNHKRLFKVLKKKGFPQGIIMMVRKWLEKRRSYIEVNGTCSTFDSITCGTLQGSVLGPVLFALFVSPLLDLIDLISYADDNYIIGVDKDLDKAMTKVKMKANLVIL